MEPETIDLTGIISDDSDVAQPIEGTLQIPTQALPYFQSGSHSRRLVSHSASAAASAERNPMSTNSAEGSNPGARQKPAHGTKSTTGTTKTATGASSRVSLGFTSPTQSSSHSTQRQFKHQTPRKTDWTTDKIEEALRVFSNEVGTYGARNSSRLLYSSWKKAPTGDPNYSKKNWFADMKRAPMDAGRGTLKLKLKVRISLDPPPVVADKDIAHGSRPHGKAGET
jgi:hypothetical protein